MNDDWRLHVTLADAAQAAELARALEEGTLEHTLGRAAVDRVIVSVDQQDLFVYSDAREQCERARQAIEALARTRGWAPSAALQRWHPAAEEWEDPDTPLPQAGPELETEREERIAREREESLRQGFSEYEVRVECPSHGETVALSERLQEEGLEPLRRWRYVLVGAADERSAQELADRLTGEAPPGSKVRVEASLAAVAADTPANPFAVFGGFGI